MVALRRITATSPTHSQGNAQGAPSAPSRALVTIASDAEPDSRSADPFMSQVRRQGTFGPFLAHLIATRERFPQTLARRRAAPQVAAAAYAAGKSAPARHTQRLARSI